MIGNTRNSKLTEPKFHGILIIKREVERCRVAEKYTITPLSELPLHNDFMFSQVMRSEEICQLFLEELLGVNIQRIEFIDRQKDLSDSYEYHGIRLDVYLKDEKGTVFNVEIQAERRDDLPRRVRFYQSGIDRGELPKGADYAILSESYIIFVCNFDYFHIGKAVGERVSFLRGTAVPYEDGSHVFFLNSRYQEANASTAILEFLDLVRTNDVEKPYNTSLGRKAKERMQEVRSDKELEVSYMTIAQKMLDERRIGYLDGVQEGMEKGMEKGLRMAIISLKGIVDPSVIAERFKMSLEQVMDILNQA